MPLSRPTKTSTFVYPDRNHGIYGGNTRLHLFNMMMDFVKENF